MYCSEENHKGRRAQGAKVFILDVTNWEAVGLIRIFKSCGNHIKGGAIGTLPLTPENPGNFIHKIIYLLCDVRFLLYYVYVEMNVLKNQYRFPVAIFFCV